MLALREAAMSPAPVLVDGLTVLGHQLQAHGSWLQVVTHHPSVQWCIGRALFALGCRPAEHAVRV